MPKEQELGYLPIQVAPHLLLTELKFGRLDRVIPGTLVECKVQGLEYSPAEPVYLQPSHCLNPRSWPNVS